MSVNAEALTKTYRRSVPGRGIRRLWRPSVEIAALRGVTFTIDPGESVGLLGPNGAGKTTVIKILCGILEPTTGSAMIGNLVPYRDRQRNARQVGVMFGARGQLWWELPVDSSLQFLADLYSVPRSDYTRLIGLLNSMFDFKRLLPIPARQLSLGQRTLCEIAACILHSPRVLFLDEPTVGLDVVTKHQVHVLLRNLNADLGVTVLLASHDVEDIQALCQRVVIINHGEVVADDQLERLRATFDSRRRIVVSYQGLWVNPLDAGVAVTHMSEGAVRLEVDLSISRLESVLLDVLRYNSVRDMSVSMSPVSEILRAAYGSR